MSGRAILHCDLNNFYASVEAVLHPELKGVPLAVCGAVEDRHGIVLAKSNPAKAYGVKTGDTVWQAKLKCPSIIILDKPNYAEYSRYSKIVREIYKRYTDRVEPFGIDECWLDITASTGLFGDPFTIAEKIRNAVREETGLTISVGVSFTKILAKLGSDLKKPDATTVISKDNFKRLVFPLPVGDLLGVGKRTAEKLNKYNILTIGDLASADTDFLVSKFGVNGTRLHIYANGMDCEEVALCGTSDAPKSIGNGTTTSEDIKSMEDAEAVIYALAETVATRMRKANVIGKGVSVSVRDMLLNTMGRQAQLPDYTDNASIIARQASELLATFYDFRIPLRTITVTVFSLLDYEEKPISLFDNEGEKMRHLDRTLDALRERFGKSALKRAINIESVFDYDTHELDTEVGTFCRPDGSV